MLVLIGLCKRHLKPRVGVLSDVNPASTAKQAKATVLLIGRSPFWYIIMARLVTPNLSAVCVKESPSDFRQALNCSGFILPAFAYEARCLVHQPCGVVGRTP